MLAKDRDLSLTTLFTNISVMLLGLTRNIGKVSAKLINIVGRKL